MYCCCFFQGVVGFGIVVIFGGCVIVKLVFFQLFLLFVGLLLLLLEMVLINVYLDWIISINVCIWFFWVIGLWIEIEIVGKKIFIYNYGYGGSGWLLFWGIVVLVELLINVDK